MDNIHLLVKTDLDNVLFLSKKYNLKVASWYWRLDETEDEWNNRLVKLSIERKEVRGYIIGDKQSLTYSIPVENDRDQVVIEMIKNLQTETLNTSYELLYETLEKYLQ